MNRNWPPGPPPPEVQMWWWGPGAPRPSRQPVPAPVPPTPVRIGDTERDQAVSALGDHFAAGRLTKDEFDERADQAMQARFSTDLAPLFADLPQQQPLAPTPPRAAGGPPPWMFLPWLLPMLVLGAVAGAILFHAPFLLWALIWVAVILKLTRRGRPARR